MLPARALIRGSPSNRANPTANVQRKTLSANLTAYFRRLLAKVRGVRDCADLGLKRSP